jgi:hypothetical protein
MSGSSQVTTTQEGRWQSSMDGATEARISLGTSDRGHHYALEVSRLGGDASSPAWSRPFRTADQAEHVAGIRSSVALGDQVPSARQEALERMAQDRQELSPAAKGAQALSNAASYRQAAASLGVGTGRESLVGAARQQLAQARAVNQVDREVSQHVTRAPAVVPARRPKPASVVIITQAMRDAARGTARNVSTTLIQPGLEFRLGWSGRLCGIELSEAAGFLV